MSTAHSDIDEAWVCHAIWINPTVHIVRTAVAAVVLSKGYIWEEK